MWEGPYLVSSPSPSPTSSSPSKLHEGLEKPSALSYPGLTEILYVEGLPLHFTSFLGPLHVPGSVQLSEIHGANKIDKDPVPLGSLPLIEENRY